MKRNIEKRYWMAQHYGTVIILLVLSNLLPQTGHADLITLNTDDRGIYFDDGYHIPWYTVYGIGRTYSNIGNHFLLFDLSSITLPVISAELRLVNNHSYDSPDPYETYTIFDVTTSLWNVQNAYGDCVATFNDLGSGVVYGSVDVPSNNAIVTVSVLLNNDGLAALNARLGGMFIVGGAVTSLDSEGTYEALFSLSNPDTPIDGCTQIVLTTIPEPATGLLISLSAMVLFWQRRKKL